MSDAQHTEHEANHEGPIRTPKQLIVAVVASFVVPIVVIIMLANFVDSHRVWSETTGARNEHKGKGQRIASTSSPGGLADVDIGAIIAKASMARQVRASPRAQIHVQVPAILVRSRVRVPVTLTQAKVQARKPTPRRKPRPRQRRTLKM